MIIVVGLYGAAAMIGASLGKSHAARRRSGFKKMRRFKEFRSYSPEMDCMASRISMVGPQNAEYFAIIRCDEPGMKYRERRQEACVAIDEAINRGDEPGEVVL